MPRVKPLVLAIRATKGRTVMLASPAISTAVRGVCRDVRTRKLVTGMASVMRKFASRRFAPARVIGQVQIVRAVPRGMQAAIVRIAPPVIDPMREHA